jgi:hypothetical protein
VFRACLFYGDYFFHVRQFFQKELFHPQTEGEITTSEKFTPYQFYRDSALVFIKGEELRISLGQFVEFRV